MTRFGMTKPEQIPEPVTTGIEGEQKPAVAGVQTIVKSPFPLVKCIEGLASTHSKGLGGEIPAAFIAGATAQIAYDLDETKGDLVRTRERLDTMQTQFAECRERKAVLEERLRSERSIRLFRDIGIAIGTALIGFAVDFYSSQFKVSIVFFALGTLLLVSCWVMGLWSKAQ